MKKVHYCAAWTDSGFFLGCDHEHPTVTSAVACINVAGGYVVAVETYFRELNDDEEAEFQLARYGVSPERKPQAEKRASTVLHWVPAK